MPQSDLSNNQTTKVPVSEAGAVPNSTSNDKKIFLGIESQSPPTYDGFTVEGGTQVSIFGNQAARERFSCDPPAMASANSVLNAAHKRNWKFLQQDGHTVFLAPKPHSGTRQHPWGQYAAKTEADVAAHAISFKNETGQSIFNVVHNPTEAWEKQAGVSGVSKSELEQQMADAREWYKPPVVRRKAGSSRHPLSQGPSVPAVLEAVDLVMTGRQ